MFQDSQTTLELHDSTMFRHCHVLFLFLLLAVALASGDRLSESSADLDIHSLTTHIVRLEEALSSLQSHSQVQEQKQAAIVSSVLSELTQLKTDHASIITELADVKNKLKIHENLISTLTDDLNVCSSNLTFIHLDFAGLKSDFNKSVEMSNELNNLNSELLEYAANVTSEAINQESNLNRSDISLNVVRNEVNRMMISVNETETKLMHVKSELQISMSNQSYELQNFKRNSFSRFQDLASNLSAAEEDVNMLSKNLSHIYQLIAANKGSLKKVLGEMSRSQTDVHFRLTLNATVHVTAATIIPFTTLANYSTGKYNIKTGKYMIPVTGLYLLWVNALVVNTDQPSFINIETDAQSSVGYGMGIGNPRINITVVAGMTVAHLTKGSEVWFTPWKDATLDKRAICGGALLNRIGDP